MPTVVRVGKFVVVIYLDDHPPAHVHVRFDGASVRVLIAKETVTLDVIEGKVSRADERRALEVVAEHLELCLKAWDKHHGKKDKDHRPERRRARRDPAQA